MDASLFLFDNSNLINFFVFTINLLDDSVLNLVSVVLSEV